MDRIRRDTLLGIVFFGALAFLLWATVMLTDASTNDVPKRTVLFADGGGAQVGTNVLVRGMRVGKVSEIDIDFDDGETPVTMTLSLKREIPFTDQALIEVRADGVLGGKVVYIDPGHGTLVPPEVPLLGRSQPDLFTRIGDIADGKGVLGENVNGMVSAIRVAFEALQDPNNTIGQLLTNNELYVDVQLGISSLKKILEAIESGQSTFGSLAMDTSMGEQVRAIVTDLATAAHALTTTEGTAGMLLNDPETAAALRAILADGAELVADAKAGKGVVGRLLRSKQLADDLAVALADLRTLLHRANDPDAGLVGAAIADSTTAEHFKLAVANLHDITDSLTQAEGALGILINDKDFGLRLKRIFTQVSRALEDAREAAPISSFVQVLLGVF